MPAKRAICMKVLPGEPLDGTGKVCIHLFVQDERGPFVEPSALHMVDNQLVARRTRGRLACDPRRSVAPVVRGATTTITCRTDDPRAVTCPKCLASADCKRLMELLSAGQAGK